MVYDRYTSGDGQWHCPFSKEWVQRMARAAKHCKMLSAEQIDAILNGTFVSYYDVPPGDFLSQPQDERGLPLSYGSKDEEWPSCCATYDYQTIPEVVVSNGYDDWPLSIWGTITLRA